MADTAAVSQLGLICTGPLSPNEPLLAMFAVAREADPRPGLIEVYRRIGALGTMRRSVNVRRMAFFVSPVYLDSMDVAISFGWKPCQPVSTTS